MEREYQQLYKILGYEVKIALIEGDHASPKAIKIKNQAIKDIKEIRKYLKECYPSIKFYFDEIETNITLDGKPYKIYSLLMDSTKPEDVGNVTVQTISYMMINNVGKNTLHVIPETTTTLKELSEDVDKNNMELEID